jgi:glutamate racemase
LQKISDEKPVGIFDSGVGGLTVMKEIIQHLPDEHILYLGDTARVPYGTRSPETVLRYSFENAGFLISRGIKILIVACNTSSAVSLDLLREKFPVPVIGVVEPGARAAVERTRLKSVAVVGTETTIRTGSYERAIKAIDYSINVSGIACPLFVPLIEEGWLDGDVVSLTAEKYLSAIRRNGADALVLGCTHYPMIKDVIENIVHIPLIDSAIETARELKRVLEQEDMLRKSSGNVVREFFVTDSTEKFAQVGERFLGHKILNISKIELEG